MFFALIHERIHLLDEPARDVWPSETPPPAPLSPSAAARRRNTATRCQFCACSYRRCCTQIRAGSPKSREAGPQFPLPRHRRTSLAEAAAPTPDAAVAPPQSAMSSPRCLFNILTSRRCLRKTTGTGKRHRRSAVLFNILACRSGRHRRLRRWQRRAAPRARRRRRSPPTPRSRASRRRRPGGQAAGQLPDALAAASSEVINGAVQGGSACG